MLQEEVIALVTELGGASEHVTRAREILSRYSSQSRQASVLTHLFDGQASVSLEPVSSEETFFPQPQTFGAESEVTEERSSVSVQSAQRYEDLGLLGRGGMGEVRRILDRDLGRTLAMKVASARVMSNPGALARFIEEAQVSAQLQHPGIIPVHELGNLPDGRFYFTMQEVRGKTLADVIGEVHAASSGESWEAAPSGWTFRRLVDAFHRACEAVAYAHERGVVHRDLKPDNIMVGEHGEVLVLDWGIAKVTGRPDLAAEQGDLELRNLYVIQTDRSQDSAQATRMGAVAGTPAYMPPEQARGEIGHIDARSDIYALGAILYELLSGRVPYVGGSARQVLRQVLAGPPEPVGRQEPAVETFIFGFDEPEETPSGPPLPAELVEACERAMAREQADRFSSAAELAGIVRSWLDGARRREQALAVVDAAQAHGPRAQGLREQAASLRAESIGLLSTVPSWAPEEEKSPGWAKEDEARRLEREAALAELEVERGLQGALRVDPGLQESHAALAERLLQEHQTAESVRDEDAVLRAEAGLRAHAGALPEGHAVRKRSAAYLKGDGALTLHTNPVGAEGLLHRYVIKNRRLVPKFERNLGKTPIRSLSLPMGSYLCVLRHPDCEEVRYPMSIGRQEHWDGVRPGDNGSTPILLPRKGTLAPDDCYVPAGWFWSGGDPAALHSLSRRRLWSEALVFKRFSVTNRQYIAFLDDLVESGRQEEALRHVPRERGGTVGELGAMIYGRDAQGRFVLRPDADGDIWEPEYPVCMVNWFGAQAYSRWFAARTGEAWRLPSELEWEKAARGVDGRFFPWGDGFDPSWCCMRDSHQGPMLPAVVDTFPVDESPYSVRGMAGNMRDWCADVYKKEGPPTPGQCIELAPVLHQSGSDRVYRGGSWFDRPRDARLAGRFRNSPAYASSSLGLRLSRTNP